MTDVDTKKSGKNIRELRIKLELTQDKMASILNITQAHISTLEKGKRLPGWKLSQKIISLSRKKGIDIDLNYLRPLEGTDE